MAWYPPIDWTYPEGFPPRSPTQPPALVWTGPSTFTLAWVSQLTDPALSYQNSIRLVSQEFTVGFAPDGEGNGVGSITAALQTRVSNPLPEDNLSAEYLTSVKAADNGTLLMRTESEAGGQSPTFLLLSPNGQARATSFETGGAPATSVTTVGDRLVALNNISGTWYVWTPGLVTALDDLAPPSSELPSAASTIATLASPTVFTHLISAGLRVAALSATVWWVITLDEGGQMVSTETWPITDPDVGQGYKPVIAARDRPELQVQWDGSDGGIFQGPDTFLVSRTASEAGAAVYDALIVTPGGPTTGSPGDSGEVPDMASIFEKALR